MSGRVAPLSLAVCALGLGLWQNQGSISPPALTGLTLALIQAWLTLSTDSPLRPAVWRPVILVCLAVQIVSLMFGYVASKLDATEMVIHAALLVCQCGVAARLLSGASAPRLGLIVTLALLVFADGVLQLRALPLPNIDVVQFQHDGVRALLSGQNPYTLEFRDPYPPDESARFYGPGVSVGGILRFGYPYMPLTLIAAVPGYWLGDVRYAGLLAVAAAVVVIYLTAPTTAGAMAALLFATSPATPVLIRGGWVEAFVVLLVAAATYAGARSRRGVPFVIGLLFASKQYFIVALPALWLVRAVRSRVRMLTTATVVGLTITLPFVLWDMHAFLHSAALLQFRQPFRYDALSYLAVAKPINPAAWTALPFAAVAAAWCVVFWRDRVRPVSLPLALGLTFAVFFALNKQAFLNYYYLVIGCLCCAIAAEGVPEAAPATATR